MLAQLVADLGADDARGIVAGLQAELETTAAALLASQGDPVTLRRHAETAKGHAEIAGAAALAAACDRGAEASALAAGCRQLAAALAEAAPDAVIDRLDALRWPGLPA